MKPERFVRTQKEMHIMSQSKKISRRSFLGAAAAGALASGHFETPLHSADAAPCSGTSLAISKRTVPSWDPGGQRRLR